MTALNREAAIRWLSHPPGGAPRLTVGSHSIAPLLSFQVDPDDTDPLATLPGELLAGAVGSVFTWLVAEQLVQEGTQARELISYVTLTLSSKTDNLTDAVLSGITCRMSGRVAGIEETHLEAVAQAAMTQCMERLGMRTEGIGITVEASLEGS